MNETEAIERGSNPYAKAFLIFSVIGAALFGAVFYTRYLAAFRVLFAYVAPSLLLVDVLLGILLYRQGMNSLPRVPLISGLAFVIGGVALDVGATIANTPALTQEGNPIARTLLDSGHSVQFVYIYGTLAQILFAALGCVLWAAFLRHRVTLIASAMNAQPRTRPQFIKAATGGPHLSWRQYFLPLKLAELPKPYHLTLTSSAILPGTYLYRWYLGLSWLGLMHISSTIALIISLVLPMIAYGVWLWFQCPGKSESATG